MNVHTARLPDGTLTWLVIGDDYLPIKPITAFLRYLHNTDKSPCTLRTYAHHLKLYWGYLTAHQLDWTTIRLDELANFVGWLRTPTRASNIINLPSASARCVNSINAILGCLSSFYQFHSLIGNTSVSLTEQTHRHGRHYKSFLHHIHKNRPVQRRIITLQKQQEIPKTITPQHYQQLLDACHNLRDQFLVALLYDTGLRIGQALALRHEDIITWDNEIRVQYRRTNLNGVYNKTRRPSVLPVSPQLMARYTEYSRHCCGESASAYVFINVVNHTPLRYPAVYHLFQRLSHKIGHKVTPHMLRHSHATDLIQAGWDAAFVQHRLGHASVQTTIDVYTHLSQRALTEAYKHYLSTKEASR